MSNITKPEEQKILANIVINGDLSGLSEREQVEYYNRMCAHVGIDPVSRPFEYMTIDGKKVLYATKSATEQIRKRDNVSVVEMTKNFYKKVVEVQVKVENREGRTDIATGVVPIHERMTPAQIANALMKAETKAKRRATLSIAGLGMIDESELDTIRDKIQPSETLPPEKKSLANESGGIDKKFFALYEANKKWISTEQIRSMVRGMNYDHFEGMPAENKVTVYRDVEQFINLQKATKTTELIGDYADQTEKLYEGSRSYTVPKYERVLIDYMQHIFVRMIQDGFTTKDTIAIKVNSAGAERFRDLPFDEALEVYQNIVENSEIGSGL